VLCLSVTRRHCIKTAERIITQTTPHDSLPSPGTQDFWRQSLVDDPLSPCNLRSKSPTVLDLPTWPSGQRTRSPCACSRAWRAQWPKFAPQLGRVRLPKRIIYNNFYAHDKQGVNPGQLRELDGVPYKLWLLLMLWLAASRCQPRWRESRSRQMWQSLMAERWKVSVRWPGAKEAPVRAGTE